jgi:carbonic anhydrase/acetyltransferase-like protein (isoleucine patch superfamily)
MELGAVVIVPGGADLTMLPAVGRRALSGFENAQPSIYTSRMPILGNDVLQSWIERVRKLGVQSLWLASGAHDGTVVRSALAGLAGQGVARLLVIKLKSYAEMDLADLLRFHCERRNPVTEAQDARGQLGVSLLDRLALRATSQKCEFSADLDGFGRIPYQFSGYAKRILSSQERQELVRDALTGACAMRPFGTEIREGVWIGEGVTLADSARVIGPSYIGAHTLVRAGATIGPFASVERDCIVDCGTTVERSTVLPHTYLAPGLLIRNGLVDGGCFEELGSGVVADLRPAGLGSRIEHRKSRRQVFSKPATDVFSKADNPSPWDCVPPSNASQPWQQVQL